MLETLLSVAALVFLALGAWGLGWPLARRLAPAINDVVAAIVWGLTLGLVVGGTVLCLVGLCGLLYAPLVLGLNLLAAFWGVLELAAAYLAWRQQLVPLPTWRPAVQSAAPEPMSEPARVIAWSALVVATLVAAITFLAALAPPTAGDALYYHLELPKRWLTEHRLAFLPDHEKATFPLLVEMWFAWGLALGDGITATLIHWLVGLLLGLATYVLARGLVGEWWGRVAGALALVVPGVANQMTAPLNDLGAALMVTMGLVAWRSLFDPLMQRRAAISLGGMLGAALAIKFLALLLIVALATVTVMLARRHAWAAAPLWRAATVAALAATVIAAPWYANAAWHRGNPVFPFFAQYLGEPAVEVLPDRKTPLGFRAPDLLSAPWQITMRPERFGGRGHQLGMLFLALLPGLVLARRLAGLTALLAVAGIYALLWYALRQNVRFLLPIVPILCTAMAWVLAELARMPRWPRRVIWSAVALATLMTPVAVARVAHSRLGVALGWPNRETYLMTREPSYRAAALLNAFGGDTPHLLSGDYRGYYFDGRFTWEKAYRLRRGAPWRQLTADQVSSALRAAGFTHVLLAESLTDPALFDAELRTLVDAQLVAERQADARSLVVLHDYTCRDSDGGQRRYRLILLR